MNVHIDESDILQCKVLITFAIQRNSKIDVRNTIPQSKSVFSFFLFFPFNSAHFKDILVQQNDPNV